MKCEICQKKNAEKVIDPFQQDINDEEVWRLLCEECVQELKNDI